MRLTILRLVTLIIILSSISYLIANILSKNEVAELSRALVFPFLLLYFCIRRRLKFRIFGFFILLYTLAETAVFYDKYEVFLYYFGVVFYVLAYLVLLIYIMLQIHLKALFNKFYVQILILFLLGSYIFYSLESIMVSHLDYGLSLEVFILDSIYNLTFILVLIFALLNYLQTDIKKNLILFLSCLSIFFFELVQVVYYFADQNKILHVVFSILLILGFYFTYIYINLEDDKFVLE